MNNIIQNLGVLALFLGALYFLATKFFFKPALKKVKSEYCKPGKCGCS